MSCQNERSQLQNREQAMRMLRARLIAAAEEAAADAASAARRVQVRTVDRSERIRTYNFPENRISDHRIGFKAYNLDAVLNGDLHGGGRGAPGGRHGRAAAAGRRAGSREPDVDARERAVRPLLDASRRDAARGRRRDRPSRTPGCCWPTSAAIEPLRLPLLDEVDDDQAARFDDADRRRARRVPLQHLTGRAYFRYVSWRSAPASSCRGRRPR